MAATYVALDLETTGLNPDTCEIIEVGAVKFTPERELETFHKLVKPRAALPYFIQRLTGIQPDDLRDAPLFAEIASELEAFLADLPVVGQNISFDLGFLAAQGIAPSGVVFDTWDLATLLLHGLTDYSLRSLANHLSVPFPQRHRALADAQATRQVFLGLRSRLADLPAETLVELQRIASSTEWTLQRLFAQVLEEAPLLGEARPPGEEIVLPGELGPPLVARTPPVAVSPAEVAAVLERPVEEPELFPGFERRQEQSAMACEVAEALNAGESLVVEAGTGTGKSLAYLAPAACYALCNSARVVVSTDTINLQEQLMGKDIPLLQRLLEGRPLDGRTVKPGSLRFAQLKGRRNYLCLLRLAALRRSTALTLAEARLLARIILWLRHTESGDRAELNLSWQDEIVWRGLSADNEACLALPCHYVRRGVCFLQRARRRAEAAHVLVVNHALLLSDVAMDGNVLPEYRHLVIDEAHNLEDEATQQFGFQGSDGDVSALLDRVYHRFGRGRASGLTESLLLSRRSQPGVVPALLGVAEELRSEVEGARRALPVVFDLLTSFLLDRATREGDYDPRLLLTRAIRIQPDWSNVEIAWENLDIALQRIIGLLARAAEALSDAEESTLPAREELLAEIAGVLQEAQRLRQGVASVLARDDADTIAWMNCARSTGSVNLFSAPLQVADALRDRLLAQKESVVLTGATLSVAGRFDYLCERVGLDEPRQAAFGSPFDYARSALLLLPSDMPEPNDGAYQVELEQAVIDLCRATEGRALVLFTSHGALGATYGAAKRPLEQEGILVLGQGIDGPPKSLLNALRENKRTVILGTASFWEGVDVVGEALSLLIMARLPFAVPTDPVFVARSALYEDPFAHYTLPQAVIRFKQGFGRLIRRKTDRGVVVILDRRLKSKSYGSVFLGSLPPCTVEELPLRELPPAAVAWLAERRPGAPA